MTALQTILGLAGVAAAAAPLMLATPTAALAHEPTVNLTSPTGPLFFASFDPAPVVPISFSLAHSGLAPCHGGQECNLSQLVELDVQVDGASIINGPLNPFTSSACSSQMTTTNNISQCTRTDAYNATVAADWVVEEAGDYTILVAVKHQSATGQVEETVVVTQVSAEYPAPPAVANAYINAARKTLFGKITSGCRGVIISEIAMNHGLDRKYGNSPGPYDVPLIQYDVEYYYEHSSKCGG